MKGFRINNLKKILIAGRKSKQDYILRYKGSNLYHRVPAKSLEEAKAKMLKGTKYTYQDIEQLKS